jgi:RimJ/RimL family protein N-acetyltransferase
MATDDRPRAFVPDGFAVPRELVTEEFRLEPLGPQHNTDDYEAWTSSIDHIRATPGFGAGKWPDPGMTLEENLADLRRHAEDFAQRAGFTYTVLARGSNRIIGCVYIYPSRRADDTADVQSWVRADRADLDVAVYDAVSAWLSSAWPFAAVSYAPRTRGNSGR